MSIEEICDEIFSKNEDELHEIINNIHEMADSFDFTIQSIFRLVNQISGELSDKERFELISHINRHTERITK